MVRFENVGLRYGQGPEVLRDLSFELVAGSFHFLTGPSGAGKSSLLSLMYLAQRPTSGRIAILERDVAATPRADMPALRRRIGVVFQDFRLLGHLSAYDNVALPMRIQGKDEDEIRTHVVDLMTWVGLGDKLAARPPTLSGGEQQRIAIARAVVTRPRLLLADEPTGNVDDRTAHRLLYLIEQLNKAGTTVVIATHNAALAGRSRHPVLEIENGRLGPRAPAPGRALEKRR